MPYGVSSYFQQQLRDNVAPALDRQLLIGGSDYSDRVVRWPRIKREWNDIRPVQLSVELANEDRIFSFFRDDPLATTKSVEVRFGVINPNENRLRFTEELDNAVWSRGAVSSFFADDEVSPLLVQNADVVVFSNQAGPGLIQAIGGVTSGVPYTFGLYLKTLDAVPSSADQVQIQIVPFAEAVSIGDQVNSLWQRFTVTNTVAANSLTAELRVFSYTGRLAVWGAQVNSGSAIQDYVRAVDSPFVAGNPERVTLFGGKLTGVRFRRGAVQLDVQDKIKPFTERVLGSSDVPLDFTGSNFLVHDLAWYLATSHGGLSAIESGSNPDIDWNAFQTWAGIFSADNVRVQARYEGKKVTEALRSLGRYTFSGIFVEGDRLSFARFTDPSSAATALDDNHLKEVELKIDDTLIVNKQHVYANYSAGGDVWGIDALAVDSVSVNSFGPREHIEKDETIWYVDSASALNMAERKAVVFGRLFEQFEVEGTLAAAVRQIGETVSITDSFHGVVASTDSFRVMGYELDLDRGAMKLRVDKSQFFEPFILDDVRLGLLDQNYNFLL